ncbi:hypothetical protein CFP56_031837 [Quercus suber]|uniref:Syntaxin n=1 Tax=Quercus suber TaxID=58331 RepID=A0AAW0LT44_QUESU
MRKLPKFIYDEEKTLERTHKILTEKIAQLNSAIDDVSAQLRGDDAPNGATVNSDEVGASIKEATMNMAQRRSFYLERQSKLRNSRYSRFPFHCFVLH